jgi:hydrogenase maturation protein HypF
MRLEAAAGDAPDAAGGYRMAIVQGPGLLHLAPDFWPALIHDIAAGTSVRLIAARCHAGLADGIARMVATLHTAGPVALSGGVFQNRRLLVGVMRRLQEDGLDVLTHRAVPANDGGLALGQAAIAAARLRGVED